MQLLASWLFNLLFWLITALSNALITILSAIWSAIIQIPLFTEFFDIWSLVGLLIEGVVTALMAAINLVLLGFKTLATFAQVILTFWGSLVAAMNDSTTASTGLPDCDTILDTDLWYPTCLTIDLISYIIAAFPNIQISIGAAGALLAIYTLIKTVSWYRESFAEVA
jgi:hypothetical protein